MIGQSAESVIHGIVSSGACLSGSVAGRSSMRDWKLLFQIHVHV